ncbi:uncharacterized protein BKCO1_1400080 [Diplodia corticola]|uniref:Uncharacterized protein n=1 Tax=Diplodia corticola TaxID=236234 RepID=A0A1J9S7Y0_9PEZI|nr:uncharacterized protein BKCO1_1400080 [Diplodia corticola]OJD36020.1 hypothetical protein BKCO1_1400080 [Diplodia corticola]
MARNSVVFGGFGNKAGNGAGDRSEAANTDNGEIVLQRRRRSSIKVQGIMSSFRRLCDGVQRQTATVRSRSGSNGSTRSDFSKKSSRSTENLVATADEDSWDAKSKHSVRSFQKLDIVNSWGMVIGHGKG